jgi:outer membrane protein
VTVLPATQPLFALQRNAWALTVAAGLSVLAAVPEAHAQSLVQLLESARNHDAGFRVAQALAQSAVHRTDQNRALLRPSVTLTGTSTHNRIDPPASAFNPGGTAVRTTQSSLSLNARQPIYNQASALTITQAERTQALFQADLLMAEHDLMLRLAQAYFDVLAAEDVRTAARAGERAIAEQLASAKRAYDVGSATITDAREAQARADLATAQRLAADNDLRVKRLALDQLVGLRGLQPNRLVDAAKLPGVDDESMDDWVQKSQTVNPGSRRAELAVEVAQLETAKARAGHMPTLDLIGSLGPSHTRLHGTPSTLSTTPEGRSLNASIGVQLALPIYQGGATQSRMQETLLLAQKANDELDLARRALAQNARAAFLSVQSGLARVKALEAAEQSTLLALQATQTGYRVGVRVNLDVLNVQSQLFQTRRDLATARYEVLMGTLRLKQAAGSLTAQDLAQLDQLMAPSATPRS